MLSSVLCAVLKAKHDNYTNPKSKSKSCHDATGSFDHFLSFELCLVTSHLEAHIFTIYLMKQRTLPFTN